MKRTENPILTGRSWTEFREWLDGKSESTRKHYLPSFLGFLDWADLNTEQLYEQFNTHRLSTDPRDKKIIPRFVRDYQTHLMETEGLKASTVQGVGKAVTGFFEANSLTEFDMGLVNGLTVTYEGKKKVTPEDIRLLMDSASNWRTKSIIMSLKEWGLRSGDLCNVKIHHIREALDPSVEFWTFEIEQEKTTDKTGIKANPCMGPEALKYLRLWFEDRERRGIPSRDEDYLYCVIESKSGFTDKRGRVVPDTEVGDKINSASISSLFTRLIKKSGLGDKNISAHSFRKFCQTHLEAGGVPETWVDKMTGRKTRGTRGTYTRPDDAQLIEMFQLGYEQLRVYGPVEQREINGIREALAMQDSRAQAFHDLYEEEAEKREALEKEVMELKEMMKKLMEKRGAVAV